MCAVRRFSSFQGPASQARASQPIGPTYTPTRRDCADLPGQFANVPGATLQFYVCHQFPDDAKTVDRLIVSLIMVAVAIPSKSMIERVFELSNDPPGYKDVWLQTRGAFRLLVGGSGWHYSGAADDAVRWHA